MGRRPREASAVKAEPIIRPAVKAEPMPQRAKTYVLDTNVLLHDPEALNAFEENDIVIPLVVIEEIDSQKKRQDEVGRGARRVAHHLDDLRQLGKLSEGVPTPGGGLLRVQIQERGGDLRWGETVLLAPVRRDVWGIQAKNLGQRFALDAFLNDEISLVTLTGRAGTGKTLLALAAGLHAVLDEHRYRRLLVTRPVIPMGKDVGYLPGDKDEKLRPWMQPIYDNLEFLMSTMYKDQMVADMVTRLQDKGLFEVEALTYIRGRSIPQQLIIVDEAQNLTPHELKTIVSRAGEGAHLGLTSDPYHIDHPYLDFSTNGLCFAVPRFRESPLAAHVTLTKGQRSELAELAAVLL